MHQQLWGYKVEEKLYLGVREQKRLNITGLEHTISRSTHHNLTRKRFKTTTNYRLDLIFSYCVTETDNRPKTTVYCNRYENLPYLSYCLILDRGEVSLFRIPARTRIRNTQKNHSTVQNKSCHKTFHGVRDFVTTSTIVVFPFSWNMFFLWLLLVADRTPGTTP
jgi:hypothetical protein